MKYGTRYSENIQKHSVPKNATYRPKRSQNDIIAICGELLTENIVSEVKEAKFFGILADEATDCSDVEQMSLVLRYVGRTCSIREEFLEFIPLDRGLSGLMISNSLMHTIQGLEFSMSLCRGPVYDGAGNMAGRISGAASRIQQMFKNTVYVHCNSHLLNLCVAASFQIQID